MRVFPKCVQVCAFELPVGVSLKFFSQIPQIYDLAVLFVRNEELERCRVPSKQTPFSVGIATLAEVQAANRVRIQYSPATSFSPENNRDTALLRGLVSLLLLQQLRGRHLRFLFLSLHGFSVLLCSRCKEYILRKRSGKTRKAGQSQSSGSWQLCQAVSGLSDGLKRTGL